MGEVSKYTQLRDRLIKYSKVINELLFYEKEVSLIDVIINKLGEDKAIIAYKKIIQDTYDYLFLQFEYYAVAQYVYMKKTNNWSSAGYDRVVSGMMQIYKDKTSDEQFNSYQGIERFESTLEKIAKDYSLFQLDEKELKKIISNPKIELFGDVYGYTKTSDINKIFKVMDAPYRVIMGHSGDFITMILGLTKNLTVRKYFIYSFYKEEMRTPNAVNYIVAVIDGNQIAIRVEVCDYIFKNKWIDNINQGDYLSFFSDSRENKISDAFKKVVYSLLEATDEATLLEKKDYFINNMAENLMYHELAHDVFEDTSISIEEMGFVQGSVFNEENILSIMNEVLTEWIPETDGLMGPIKNICNVAMNDKKRAKLLMYMYLSDGWFLDTDTEFMYSYTYIMFAVFSKYISKGGDIDFTLLNNDLINIFEQLKKWFIDIICDASLLMKKQKFMVSSGDKVDFKEFRARVNIIMELSNLFEEEALDEKEKVTQSWINVFSQAKKISPAVIDSVSELLKNKEKELNNFLISEFGGQGAANKYGADLRGYVIDFYSDIFEP